MAVKKVTQIICDRCDKVIEGDSQPPSDEPSAPAALGTAAFNGGLVATPTAPRVYVEGSLLTDTTKIHFVDLCAKCVTRVQALLSQIRLDDVPKDEAKGDDAKANLGDNPGSTASKPKTATKDATSASAKP